MDRAGQSLSVRQIVPIAGILYFAEGLPYGFVNELLPIFLRQSGATLIEIGFLSSVSLAWTLKFFWSPAIDHYSSYRRWITATLAIVSLALILLGALGGGHPDIFWGLLILLAVAAATHDIAIDALTIVATPERDLGLVNSIRVTTYRLAIIIAGGALAALADRTSWRVAFWSAAALTLAIAVYSLTLPPIRGARKEDSNLWAGLRRWLAQPHSSLILAVVLLFRLADSTLTPMIKPYWVDHGYSATEIGAVTTIAGMSFTILGAWAGGVAIRRLGILPALFWMGVVQTLSNGGYAIVASLDAGRPGLYSATIIENFCGGLGIAAFLAFMMFVCDREHAATEYALLSALFVLSRSLAGSLSGVLAQSLGYAPYFWVSLTFGIPGLLAVSMLVRRTRDYRNGGMAREREKLVR